MTEAPDHLDIYRAYLSARALSEDLLMASVSATHRYRDDFEVDCNHRRVWAEIKGAQREYNLLVERMGVIAAPVEAQAEAA